MNRRPIWEWACDYVGDPDSWHRRGEVILGFLQENGLTAGSYVLDVGCGNLSEGRPLIEELTAGRFVGIEPNGWLVEAALDRFRELEAKKPEFLWRTDFDASELGIAFDFVVSHSVLSHCAHWQLPQFLANTRKVVDEGAVMLASYRNDQYNGFAEEWCYPGVNTFREATIVAAGHETGWLVERRHDYRERMLAECPNDAHDWIRCVAVPTAAEMNERRLADEALQDEERSVRTEREMARVATLGNADLERVRAAGLLP